MLMGSESGQVGQVAGLISMKPPPPMPDEKLLTTPMHRAVAIAASVAVPFDLSTVSRIRISKSSIVARTVTHYRSL